jgi:predicted  nucleic acid-binding Zn-ribbon protein
VERLYKHSASWGYYDSKYTVEQFEVLNRQVEDLLEEMHNLLLAIQDCNIGFWEMGERIKKAKNLVSSVEKERMGKE